MRRFVLVVALLLPTFAFSDDLIVGTVFDTSSAGGYNIDAGQVLAQKFTLTDTVLMDSLAVALGGTYINIGGGAGTCGPPVDFTMELVDALGTGSNVIREENFTFPASSDSYQVLTFSLTQNTVLNPGDYYVVIANQMPDTDGYITWVPTSADIPSTLGSTGHLYTADGGNVSTPPNESTFGLATTPQHMQFQLLGKRVGAPVPEPATLAFIACGIIVIVARGVMLRD